MSSLSRVWKWLAVLWCGVSALLLLGVAIHIMVEPGFPLGLGLIQTRGIAGLWATLLPSVACVGGLVLLRRARRLGAGLLLAYTAFWAVILGSLVLTLRRESWIAGLVVLGLVPPFVVVGIWCGRTLLGSPSGAIAAESSVWRGRRTSG
jgi:hypothetical protein